MTKDQIVEAICNSQKLEGAGLPVIGIVKDEEFVLNGVIRQGITCRQTLVCVSAKDRQRFRSIVPQYKNVRLLNWTEWESKVYSGFYVPLEWFDSVKLQEAR